MTQEVVSIPIAEATPAQMRDFATKFLNLDLAADASDDNVRSAVAAAQPGAALIFALPAADAPTEEEEQREAAKLAGAPDDVVAAVGGDRSVGTLGRGDPRYLIHIPVIETEDESGSMDVEVGVNGRAWKIMRGVDASVPARVVEALKNARGLSIRHVPDTHGNVDVTETPFQRHGFNVLESPTKAEMDEWHRQTDDIVCA